MLWSRCVSWKPARPLMAPCAMVIANEELAAQSPGKPAWIRGSAMRSEPTMYAGREQVNPQAGRDCAKDVYKQAGISNPRKDFDCAEVYVPFSWYEPMWLENLGFAEEGKGWELTMNGATSLTENGDIPWNCSGGVLCSKPDWGLRYDSLCRSRTAGPRCGRRSPSGWRQNCAWPRLWRWCAVLLNVGGQQREALTNRHAPALPFSSLGRMAALRPHVNVLGCLLCQRAALCAVIMTRNVAIQEVIRIQF